MTAESHCGQKSMLEANVIAMLLGLQATVVSLDLDCERVIPSNDGIQFDLADFSLPSKSRWAPAFAGVTGG